MFVDDRMTSLLYIVVSGPKVFLKYIVCQEQTRRLYACVYVCLKEVHSFLILYVQVVCAIICQESI